MSGEAALFHRKKFFKNVFYPTVSEENQRDFKGKELTITGLNFTWKATWLSTIKHRQVSSTGRIN